ncbi:hypothetical protein QBC45DRAFT_444367 [Copromyces sp. CBS 386.78]|nr:hypothetical protein QBC45DRAFT_444367 [Copromyces sp. CBS 386.78]
MHPWITKPYFVTPAFRHASLLFWCFSQITATKSQTTSVPSDLLGVYIGPDGVTSSALCPSGWTFSVTSTYGACCRTGGATCNFITACGQATNILANGDAYICKTQVPYCITQTVFDTFPSPAKSWLDLRCVGDGFLAHSVYREISALTMTTTSTTATITNSVGSSLLPSRSQVTATSSTPSSTSSTPQTSSNRSNGARFIVGISVLGAVLGIVAFIASGFWVFRKRQPRRMKGTSQLPESGHGSLNPLVNNNNNNNNNNRCQRPSPQQHPSVEQTGTSPTPPPNPGVQFGNFLLPPPPGVIQNFSIMGSSTSRATVARVDHGNFQSQVLNQSGASASGGTSGRAPTTTPNERGVADMDTRDSDGRVHMAQRPVFGCNNQSDTVLLSGGISEEEGAPGPGSTLVPPTCRGRDQSTFGGAPHNTCTPANVHQLHVPAGSPRAATANLGHPRPLLLRRRQNPTGRVTVMEETEIELSASPIAA